jgi:hypothetical protein
MARGLLAVTCLVLAKGVGGGKAPVGPEIDKSGGKAIKGRFWHYHPYNPKPGMHSFYGMPE